MRLTTYQYVTARAVASGISPSQINLMIEPDDNNPAVWEVYVTYNGKDDEVVIMGDTAYEVNVVDWIAENVATEATIEGGIDSEPHWWKVALYPFGTDADTPPMYERNEDECGPVLCSANGGGDPASGCDELVTGHDMLCTRHRLMVHQMSKNDGEGE